MYPYGRMAWIAARALRGPALGPLEESRLRLRVWPQDLDVNLHLNNGRFLTLMDLGRFDLLLRAGLLREMWRRRLAPVVGASTAVFRRPLQPFEAFELRTRIGGWDERWLYICQDMVRGRGDLAARAWIRGQLRDPGGLVAPATLAADLGLDPESPELPAEVTTWVTSTRELRAGMEAG